ncbi:carotenoid biosynthesis protein [Desertifilum sp. FACHB-1129]|uniref:Carotenoid biosynthesis protein n=2 Tax=Cyanophyceae TaxID=3028117 RepID=A0A1E5QLR6_9CYAN|nr:MULTISPECIES: carotenoid biosynthesis protein [Cyanophyceae]MCD8487401.1 carotenoid biosynthesis protein [Desertifilum sp.]MDA0208754.1 carotenoid biosynthesis protein [Cyanobacteria bacterium FC1]MDI9640315.1 carotenoid biosynthesis protein [Geitlerinema splendidum]MDK3159180.1 carotenoid biosynthesis protein [Kamptonema cortianum]MBD2310956.1 carotenoid biosynthesis protein [Desertifilum sp. FACHB-1129]
MKQVLLAERFCLIGHIVALVFGLVGLLVILPNTELIMNLPPIGQTAMQWSMAGGGVAYIILGAIAVALYAYRILGLGPWLAFMVPSVAISLSSELLGTSTGFPFGHYQYLSGLGYKVAGLVPFTIPLSWFYLGLVSYLIARSGLEARKAPRWLAFPAAIALGALLLTSWDFVLDPAMSQTMTPFWTWKQPGAFFGMPYQNFAGWMGTGVIFMSVATLLWKKTELGLTRSQLNFALVVYLSNFAFGGIMSLAAGFWVPVGLGVLVGVVPAVALWWAAKPSLGEGNTVLRANQREVTPAPLKVAAK